MDIVQKDNGFYMENEDGLNVAFITYQYESDDIIVANHTFVDESLRGQGVAKELLDRLADFARENNLKVRPLCSYVVKAFNTYNNYEDIAIQ